MTDIITTAEVTPRGFKYWRISNRDYSGEPEYVIEVQESSLATEAKIWLGKGGSDRMHLSEAAARAIRDALTELLADQPTEPARCAPSREDLAAALKAHNFSRMTCLDHSHYGVSCDEVCHGVTDNQYLHHADAVQALYASQRTEAEVKAEALREAIAALEATDPIETALIGIGYPLAVLDDLANRLATAQPVPDVPEVGLPIPEVPNVGGEDHA